MHAARLAAVLCLTASTAWAESAAISSAQVALSRGEFEQVVRGIGDELEKPDLSETDRVELYRLLGLAHLYLGNEAAARKAYAKLLAAKPDYVVPESEPPKIRQMFGRLQAQIRKREQPPVHVTDARPVGPQEEGKPVSIEARFEPPLKEQTALLRYRRHGAERFSSTGFHGSTATVPAFDIVAAPYEYFIEVLDAQAQRIGGLGDEQHVQRFVVAARRESTAKSWTRSPWLWAGVGVAVIGATAVALASQGNDSATLPIRIRVEANP